jgi:hypothetical protein
MTNENAMPSAAVDARSPMKDGILNKARVVEFGLKGLRLRRADDIGKRQ